MNNIILETLKSKLQSIQKKRDILYNEMNRNYYAEIMEIRDRFKDILHRHGANSEEAKDFAFKYADKEKELFKLAKKENENSDKNLNKLLEYDRQIQELSNEIYLHEIRG